MSSVLITWILFMPIQLLYHTQPPTSWIFYVPLKVKLFFIYSTVYSISTFLLNTLKSSDVFFFIFTVSCLLLYILIISF